MSAPPRTRDLERMLAELPEGVVGEIVFGELVTQPRPVWKHGFAATRLGHVLGPAFQDALGGPGGWVFLDEPELQLGPHVLVPDVAGWRVDALPEGLSAARVDIAPDWACEVLSPSTERRDRSEKTLIYGANGVAHLWLVDPIARTLEVRHSERGVWRDVATFEGDVVVRAEPFDAIEFDIGRLWSR